MSNGTECLERCLHWKLRKDLVGTECRKRREEPTLRNQCAHTKRDDVKFRWGGCFTAFVEEDTLGKGKETRAVEPAFKLERAIIYDIDGYLRCDERMAHQG